MLSGQRGRNRYANWGNESITILHDVGRSINPAIDIGQMVLYKGWDGSRQKSYIGSPTRRPLVYPCTFNLQNPDDIPHIFNVKLFDNQNQADTAPKQ